MKNYVLDDKGKPKPEPDLFRWAHWYETFDRHVGWDKLGAGKEAIVISTVFLAVDHGFGESGDPVLWETMIFGGAHDQYMERYTSREAAIEGHKNALRLATAALKPV